MSNMEIFKRAFTIIYTDTVIPTQTIEIRIPHGWVTILLNVNKFTFLAV